MMSARYTEGSDREAIYAIGRQATRVRAYAEVMMTRQRL